MMPSRKRRVAKLVFFVLPAMLVVFALMIWAVFGLWNWLMPSIFGLHAITYWQALGLMILSWLLFRGFRGPSFARHGMERGMWRRFDKMTPAEREEFLKGLRSRWGGSPSAEPEPKA